MIAFPIAWKNSGKHVCDVPKDASGRVQLDYVPLSETWGAMEELVDAGLAKGIGLANFCSQLISDLLSYCRSGNTMNSELIQNALPPDLCSSHSIKPVVNEVEMHPELQQGDVLRFGKAFGVHILGCFPFGSPAHTAHGASRSPDEPLADEMLNCATICNVAKRHRFAFFQSHALVLVLAALVTLHAVYRPCKPCCRGVSAVRTALWCIRRTCVGCRKISRHWTCVWMTPRSRRSRNLTVRRGSATRTSGGESKSLACN
jgi:hypothetical protein